ncbi:hypothetical protein C1T17_03735 [Sphingobium sp. SCG-1]|nr:hypothetical protein C1T17_03735 [Sphingobium sp. SCG-1]
MIVFGIGMIAALLFAELLLRVLPTPAGIVGAAPDPAWPAHRMVPNSGYVSSSGWSMENVQRGHINNRGYVAPFAYRKGATVGVVIGDSFVEGMMNPYAAMLQSQLAHAMGRRPDSIYNFGTSGASLPHYLGIAQLVGRDYRPQFAVVFIAARDFMEGFNSDPGIYRWSKGATLIEPVAEKQRGGFGQILRSLAIVRYARVNLKATAAVLTKSGFEEAPKPQCGAAVLSGEDQNLLARWVEQFPKALNLPAGKVVLLFDADRPAIYSRTKSQPCLDRDAQARLALMKLARQAGMRVVDTEPVFRADWTKHQIAFDRAPVDAHWSPYAHRLIAPIVAAQLNGR